MHYDADVPPDPKAWLELDDTERIDLVAAYHRRFHLPFGGSAKLHGAVHAVVENQVALGNATAVPATLTRLMDEGLGRHDAIHAVGSVLVGIIFDAPKKTDDGGDLNVKYGRELAALTAAGGRSQKD
jgi:hypothetical protein